MNPQLVSLIIAEIAVRLPSLAIDLVEVLRRDGTPEEWAALRTRWDRPAESFYRTPPKP